MMILSALETHEILGIFGRYRRISIILTKHDDIHKAAAHARSEFSMGSDHLYCIEDGEFYDTDTHRVWHVDDKGHTKGDYRSESIKSFTHRWVSLRRKVISDQCNRCRYQENHGGERICTKTGEIFDSAFASSYYGLPKIHEPVTDCYDYRKY